MRFTLVVLFSLACRSSVTKVIDPELIPPEEIDSDGDGYTNLEDCDDSNAAINSSVEEVCDGIDNNCDGNIDENVTDTFYEDFDGDGFGDPTAIVEACESPEGTVPIPNDCDDTDDTIYPGAPEFCDGVDSNCDGILDESSETFYVDADGDGFGDPNSQTESCGGEEGLVTNSLDCDDTLAEVNPNMEEICDGLDNDCNGAVDEDLLFLFYVDADGDQYGGLQSVEACELPIGYTYNSEDCDDSDPFINPAAIEVCDGLDNNCDLLIDEGLPLYDYYADADADGFGDPNSLVNACIQPPGMVSDNTDCDDANGSINPSVSEVCNGVDDDCNAQTDDGLAFSSFYSDTDGDGFGDVTSSVSTCLQPSGMVADFSDCDDSDGTVNPSAPEVCNGVDDDCNSQVDDGLAFVFYFSDADGDGFGDAATQVSACLQPSGTVTDNNDCDDTTASVSPAEAEVCNGIDDDCDGLVDAGAIDAISYYPDYDGDGYGAGNPLLNCQQPIGYSATSTDCDDTNVAINPAAPEVCNGVDDNCNTQVDDGVVFSNYYLDSDGDGYGAGSPSLLCQQPNGYSSTDTDCDDSNAAVNPVAVEICNGVDDDCNTQVDDGLVFSNYYADLDGDGFGDASLSFNACNQPSGTVPDNTDCDDNNATTNPDATEVCNGVDDDCNTQIDDGVLFNVYYADGDGDGFGDPASIVSACSQPSGAVVDNTDCDDTLASINPAASEVCNGLDDDCDTFIDDSSNNAPVWYYDTDGDGYGSGASVSSCNQPTGYVTLGGDCDESDVSINPSAFEVCDGLDNDCDGTIDSSSACPCNHETYGNHSYLFCTSSRDWNSALSDCESQGNYSLVTIDNGSEQNWVRSTAAGHSSNNWWWIGYNDINSENNFSWIDGSPTNYSNWPGNQPDNYNNEDCVHIYTDTGYWNDMQCWRSEWYGTQFYFVCESMD